MNKFLKLASVVFIPTIFLSGCVIKESTPHSHHHKVTNQNQDAQGVPENQQTQRLDCSVPLPVDAVNSQIDAYESQCN